MSESKEFYHWLSDSQYALASPQTQSCMWAAWQAARADTHPPAKVPEWIKCSERLPTEADADCNGNVWVVYKNLHEPILLRWRVPADHSLPNDFWMPTGLKRPNPPQTEGE